MARQLVGVGMGGHLAWCSHLSEDFPPPARHIARLAVVWQQSRKLSGGSRPGGLGKRHVTSINEHKGRSSFTGGDGRGRLSVCVCGWGGGLCFSNVCVCFSHFTSRYLKSTGVVRQPNDTARGSDSDLHTGDSWNLNRTTIPGHS